MSRLRYRIVPAMFSNYKLERWHGLPFLGFWDMETVSDDYDKLVEIVTKCNGNLVNRQPTQQEEQ